MRVLIPRLDEFSPHENTKVKAKPKKFGTESRTVVLTSFPKKEIDLITRQYSSMAPVDSLSSLSFLYKSSLLFSTFLWVSVVICRAEPVLISRPDSTVMYANAIKRGGLPPSVRTDVTGIVAVKKKN